MDHSYLFKLLNIPDDGSIIVNNVEIIADTKYVYISQPSTPSYCPNCFCRMYSKGIYKRKIKHSVLQDGTCIIFVVSRRRWKCTNCSTYVNGDFPFFQRYKQSSDIIPLLALEAMKDLDRSTTSIARQLNLSDTQVHGLFTAYVDLPRLVLPEFLSVDEVHVDISEKEKYALILMDFASEEIVDILHDRRHHTIENYFFSIPYEEGKHVRYIISDAYKPYLELLKHLFPNAVSILDSFHVVKYLLGLISTYISSVVKAYKDRDLKGLEKQNHDTSRGNKTIQEPQEAILLRKYRRVLLKNQDNINYSDRRYYHSSLRIYADTYTIEKLFPSLDPKFDIIRDVKEKYIRFNNTHLSSGDEVMQESLKMIEEFKTLRGYIPCLFSQHLDEYRHEIARSFIITEVSRRSAKDNERYYARLSNGPMESSNRRPKDYKRSSRGSSNFNYTRNRILWFTRNRPASRNTPKPSNEVYSYVGKKRGKYKVKE